MGIVVVAQGACEVAYVGARSAGTPDRDAGISDQIGDTLNAVDHGEFLAFRCRESCLQIASLVLYVFDADA